MLTYQSLSSTFKIAMLYDPDVPDMLTPTVDHAAVFVSLHTPDGISVEF